MNDGTKPRMELLDPDFLLAMGELMRVGAVKHNDREPGSLDMEEYRASILRHTCAAMSQLGYATEETVSDHYVAIAVNAMMAWMAINLYGEG